MLYGVAFIYVCLYHMHFMQLIIRILLQNINVYVGTTYAYRGAGKLNWTLITLHV